MYAENFALNELKKYFSRFRSIEKYIAIKNNKLPQYVQKWEGRCGEQFKIGQDINEIIMEYVLEV